MFLWSSEGNSELQKVKIERGWLLTLNDRDQRKLVGSSVLDVTLISEAPSLNIIVKQFSCEPQERLAVIFERAPKPFEPKNCVTLSTLKREFRCGV